MYGDNWYALFLPLLHPNFQCIPSGITCAPIRIYLLYNGMEKIHFSETYF